METKEIEEALAAPFDPAEIKFRPTNVKGNRALALPYIDARHVQDRLDQVCGVAGWQDTYECLPDGSVVCRLQLRIGGEWITKMDVGGPSEQPDEGDRRKAAFSDALKRAAVKFGVGRYLYQLGAPIWADFDPQKKQFVSRPRLPASAPAPRPAAKPAPAKKPAAPATGAELQDRLLDYGRRLAAQKLCEAEDLYRHVLAAGLDAGQPADMARWDADGIALAIEKTKAFEANCRQPKARAQTPAPQEPPAGEAAAEEHDPAEVIGPAQRQELAQLMKRAQRTWDKCVTFLKLPGGTALSDLSFAHYQLLRKGLQEIIDAVARKAAAANGSPNGTAPQKATA